MRAGFEEPFGKRKKERKEKQLLKLFDGEAAKFYYYRVYLASCTAQHAFADTCYGLRFPKVLFLLQKPQASGGRCMHAQRTTTSRLPMTIPFGDHVLDVSGSH